jgi:hypothetical protein
LVINTVVPDTFFIAPPHTFGYYTLYYWRIASINGIGQGSFSTSWTFRPLGPIGISLISSEIPTENKLYNNYPNPFNPSSNIKYQIIKNANTVLRVYDILGKEVITLVNEKQSPGIYGVTFDGSNLPNGIYFYSIHSGDFTDTKRMVLIK